MKRKSQYFIGIMIVAIVVISLYVSRRYSQYKDFLIAAETLPHEFKLAEFYAEFARFPKNADEYRDFVKLDPWYTEEINTTGCYLKYDSLNELIVLYSPGFDGDDDKLRTVYNPYEVTFASSLVKEGDVILQVRNVAGFLYILKERFIILRESRPDSTLKPVLNRLWNLAKCYADTAISDEERGKYSVIPSDASSEYGYAWIEFRRNNGTTTLRIYSELEDSLTKRIEKGLLLEVNKRKILETEDNVVVGFPFIPLSAFCLENLKENDTAKDG